MSKITKISIEAMHLNKSIVMDCADISVENNFTPSWSSEEAYGKMDCHGRRQSAFRTTIF